MDVETLSKLSKPARSLKSIGEELIKYWNTGKDRMPILHNSGVDNIAKQQRVANECNLDQLAHSSDSVVTEFEPGSTGNHIKNDFNSNDSQLKFVQAMLKHKEKSSHSPFLQSVHKFRLVELPEADMSTFCEEDMNNEIVISLRFYKPLLVAYGVQYNNYRFAQEIKVLGNNYLVELRKYIECVCENKRFFDVSENPNAVLPTKTTDPAYFFINDTFYDDYDPMKEKPYSICEREWLKNMPHTKDKTFQSIEIQNVKFNDLNIRFEEPYLYFHHGNCQHIFCVSDVSLLNKGHRCVARNQYPHVSSVGTTQIRPCFTCGGKHYSNFVMEGNARIAKDPVYMCKTCFISFNYINGKKIGEFKAYRLYDYVDSNENVNEIDADENSSNENGMLDNDQHLADQDEMGAAGTSESFISHIMGRIESCDDVDNSDE